MDSFMKLMSGTLILILICSFPMPACSSWTEYSDVRYMDLDGDSNNEIIIEAKHSVGSNQAIEDIRIFKDDHPELRLIFHVRTLDRQYGPFVEFTPQDTVSTVTFTEPQPENYWVRDIIVESKTIYYKDDACQIVDREEELGTKVFKWNGEIFAESE